MNKTAGVILVDDDGTTNFLNQRLLQNVVPAQRVLVAQHGAEGLALLRQVLGGPDAADPAPWLVLLDVKMPVMDGFAFLEAYQQLPTAQQRRAAVVMLTTSLHPADLERLQRLPITGLIAKPLTAAKLTPLLQGESPAPVIALEPVAETVFQLLYRSRATRSLSEAELYALLSQARQVNATQHITGVLLCWRGHYVQVLEGPEAAVRAVYACIKQDPRHTQVTTLGEGYGQHRSFGYWRMALMNRPDPAAARLVDTLLAQEPLPQLPVAEALLRDICATLATPSP